ncbi:hypothetical protein DEA8626_01252 [Defluviimonas aquaemixtae]|uniref:DUF192 domain-containing protein n=1 Tax=Albidovulum aquaemixtae TaxID=1542388 RepID=A0A2R8B518_9RHOB|nr:DUF192 domain-containing protein [Defluviimonas aquaemixtae]SPH17726.1 hypothetical protein DEA8626_01252 [Defluviimonas aquaemixtae]
MITFRVAALLALLAGPAAAECAADLAEFRWPGGEARFAVEIADTAQERGIGLMHRDNLPASTGMLFIYEQPQDVSFWMKNTLIPLDMIFIGPDGRVNAVHPMAVPHDETPIPGPGATLMVLEINGGLAERIGLGEGAALRHPALDQETALWPCNGS